MRLTQYKQESFINITELYFQEKLPSHAVKPISFSFSVWLLSALLMLASCTAFPLNPIQTTDTECELNTTNSKHLSDGWLFRLDPDNVGLLEGWPNGVVDKNEWVALTPGEPWEASGFDYDGVAWYSTEITLPDWHNTYLGYGKVDDSATMWINSNKVETLTNMGSEASLVDLGKYGKAGDKLQISIRIVDHGGYGGIKQPIILGQDLRLVITPL